MFNNWKWLENNKTDRTSWKQRKPRSSVETSELPVVLILYTFYSAEAEYS